MVGDVLEILEEQMRTEEELGSPPPVTGRWKTWWLFRKPPRWLFHLALLPAAFAILWGSTAPGFSFELFIVAIPFIAIGGLTWLIRLAGAEIAHRHIPTHRPSRWFLVAPIALALVIALAWTRVPLRVRWMVAKSDFARFVESAPAPTDRSEWRSFDVPSRIGTYGIIEAARVGDGVIFYESTGSFLDDAGFAYLPSGPFPELDTGAFEDPDFFSLGGGWYSWTASW